MSDEDIIGREVEMTYTWVVTVLPGQSPIDALREYVNSVGWAYDEPSTCKDPKTGEAVDPNEEVEEVPTYEVVRFYRDAHERNQTVIKSGLTREEAQEHCNDPETSSRTATSPEAVAHTEEFGAWFDGFREE